jgi:hypothetical protein
MADDVTMETKFNPLKPKREREREERKSEVGSERHYI